MGCEGTSPPRNSIGAMIEEARAAERAGDGERALACYEAAFSRLGSEGDAATAADLLRWIGTLYRERGELEVATELYGASLTVAEANALHGHEAHALNCLAVVEQYRGALPAAEERYLAALALAERHGEQRLAAMVDQNLGILANIRGDTAKALSRYHSALARARQLEDTSTVILTLNNMGMAHVDLTQWANAERCFGEASELAEEMRDAGMVALVALNRAELYLQTRDFERARDCCDIGLETYSRLDSKYGQAEAHKFYGVLYRETGKPHLAEMHLVLALQLARQCQDLLLEAEAEREHALLHLAAGRNPETLQCLTRAHRLFTELQARHEVADIDEKLDGLEEVFLQVVRAWAESIEAKDAYTAGHCERVAAYACALAEALGITGRELVWFRMGALLHDVGKMDTPVEVLNKPGKLDAEEWVQMKRHPVVGDEIVAQLGFPFDIRPIVRSHHEHWVGTGYPDGLVGEAIPLHARILCLADVFDALTTTRSYRPALSRAEALQIMERDSGRIFDPQLFALFRTLVERPGSAGRLRAAA